VYPTDFYLIITFAQAQSGEWNITHIIKLVSEEMKRNFISEEYHLPVKDRKLWYSVSNANSSHVFNLRRNFSKSSSFVIQRPWVRLLGSNMFLFSGQALTFPLSIPLHPCFSSPVRRNWPACIFAAILNFVVVVVFGQIYYKLYPLLLLFEKSCRISFIFDDMVAISFNLKRLDKYNSKISLG